MGGYIGEDLPLPFGEPARQPQRGLSGFIHAAMTIAPAERFCYALVRPTSRDGLGVAQALPIGEAPVTEWLWPYLIL